MGNVPELRFSEFSNLWTQIILGDFTKINQGLQIPIADRYPEKVKGSHFYITNEFLRKNSNKSYFILNPTESVICNQDDILMTRTGNTGQVVTGVNGAFHNNFFKIKFDTSKYSKNFIVYFLRLRQTQNLISRLAGTSTIPDLNHGDFYKIPFQTPDLKEQQKIADFLSSVDNKISLLTEKQNLLQRYKKGVMQKLLSQELRFKNDQGNDFPDWEVKKLSDFCESLSGHPVKGEEIVEASNEYPLMRGINITEGKIRHRPEIDRFHGNFSEKNERYLLQTNDVVVAMDGSKVGKNVAKITDIDSGSYLIQRVTRLRSDNRNDLQYVYHHITSNRFRQYVDTVNTSSGIPHISLKQIRDFPIKMPEPYEQKKISSYLSNIDKKIDSVNEQIKQTKIFKKGLLQKMFV